MKRNQVNEILTFQTKRRNVITVFVFFIIIVSILSFLFFGIYINRSKGYYVTYDEKSDILYKVYLKENDFFENDYLDRNKQYVASLIDKINADFKYDLSFDTAGIEYKYKYEYEINANIQIYDKETKNVLFNKKKNLVSKKTFTSKEKEVNITEPVTIDYNYFNELANKFISVYDLDDVESVLTIDMNINTVGNCDDFKENEKNSSTISLTIPLTKKTIAIELSNDLIETENNILLCNSNNFNYFVLGSAIILMLLDFVLVSYLVNYEIKTRTVNTIYTKKLRKILNNYGAYIQELTDDFSFKGYQLIKIRTFEDLLEIRDTIKQPILMKEDKEKNSSYFVIPSNSKILYVYRLKVSDLEKEFRKNRKI